MSTVHKVKMITHYQDNYDGSSTTTHYNSKDELKSQLTKYDDWDEDRWQALLDDDAPYENGSLDETTLEVRIADDGSITIKPFSSYSGNQ